MKTSRKSGGCWNCAKLQVDMYLGLDIPHFDAKVVAYLCIGDTTKYELLRDSELHDCWVVDNMAHNIYMICEDKKDTSVLGKALLWACFDGDLLERIHTQYERMMTLSSGVNPVKKVTVDICRHKCKLFIDELLDPGAAVSSDLPASHDAVQSSSDLTNYYRRRAQHRAEIQAVFSQLRLNWK